MSTKQQLQQPQSSDMKKNDNNKTYIWIKLHNGQFIPDGSSSDNSKAIGNRKRGAPSSYNGSSNGNVDDEVWGWSPGYYSLISDANNTDNTVSSTATPDEDQQEDNTATAQQYQITLLNPHPNQEQESDTHIISQTITNKLLSNGNIVLANSWEEYDFINRLQTSSGEESDDESYNYDEESSDSDEEEVVKKSLHHLIDEEQVINLPPSNLIELTHLHEPSVVHALRYRYENTSCAQLSSSSSGGQGEGESNMANNIYTDTGPILLAVNPFKHDKSGLLYGDMTVDKYRNYGEKSWLKERGGTSTSAGSRDGEEKETKEIDIDLDEEGETSLPPHVYAVADRTFRTMMTRLHSPTDISSASKPRAAPQSSTQDGKSAQQQVKINQSVLVSGESGAGKTVTTKLLMSYLSKLSEKKSSTTTDSSADDNSSKEESMTIEKRVLESNPIMESFGNARTIRNDNSSRFGKYIEMKFVSGSSSKSSTDEKQQSDTVPGATLVGASIETYLLEKVRLVHQSPGERNYHIFYELFSMKYGDDDKSVEEEDTNRREQMVENIGLLNYDMEDFRLINTSDTYDRRDGVIDSDTFNDMKQAMTIMGFTSTEIHSVFQVTTALLHASNLSFERIGEVECALETDNAHLDYVVDLLGITKEGLNSALCYYEITIGGTGRKGGETHKRVLSIEQCEKGVEALIKATYGSLFNYLVKRINASVAGDVGRDSAGSGKVSRTRRGLEKEASIGILDIFGFESFQVNSFEQLCINYCNEALQQQFNRFVLRNEQEEYDREGIPWVFIEFPENQDVLDLIDFKGTGILNMLHDQCRTPGASDKTFALAMYEKCSSHDRFEADSRQVAEQLFAVNHYTGLVEYDVEGFVEKNRDEPPKSGLDLLLSSSNEFVKTLAEILQPVSTSSKGKKTMTPRSGATQRPTVGIQFSSQLHSLRRKIDDTSPHYIRCLKPNNLLVPDHFDAALIADQLRCAGVIEAVRVSRLGYPQRFSHNQFISRYRILGRKLKKKSSSNKKYNPAKALVHSISQRLENQPEDVGIQVGKTKVFLRRQAYDLLETLRRDRASEAAITIQKQARGYLCRRSYVKALHSILLIQCFVRQVLAKRLVTELRQQYNSIIIQRTLRRYVARKRYISASIIARFGQTHYRGYLGRQIYNELNRGRSACYLQSRWRGYLALKSFRRQINAVLIIQCARRCHLARAELKVRIGEARNLSAVVQERDRLRQAAATLRNELKKVKDESQKAEPVHQDDHIGDVYSIDSLNAKDAEIESLRTALEKLSKEKESTVNELDEVSKTLTSLKAESALIVQDRDDVKQMNKMLQTELNTKEEEIQGLKKDLKVANEKSNVTESYNAQAAESSKIITNTTQVVDLKKELEELREAHSKLQKDNDHLKDENSALTKSLDESKKSLDKPVHYALRSPTSNQEPDTPETSRALPIEEKSPGVVVTTVCTSLTDMDGEEREVARLQEENQMLRKQLELLRVTNEYEGITDDQEYDESVAPGSASGDTEEYADANAMPESVMKQICSEVEACTEQVIKKTRAESEYTIAKLQCEIDSLKEDLERNKRLAKYDVDDMTRVNRSLRADLEAMAAEKLVLEEDLEEKCNEFDTLNEDVERFAETFAAQHEELQQVESQAKKLKAENKKLKASIAEKKTMIDELKSQLITTPSKVESEISKLWSEVERLRETPSSTAAATPTPAAATTSAAENLDSFTEKANYQHEALDLNSSDSSSEDEKDTGLKSIQSPLSLFTKGSPKPPASAVASLTHEDVSKDLTDSQMN